MNKHVGVLSAIMPFAAYGRRNLFCVDCLTPEILLRFTLSESATVELAKTLFPEKKDVDARNTFFEAFADEPALMVAIPFYERYTASLLLKKLRGPQGDVLSAVVADMGEMGAAVPSSCDLVCEVKPEQLHDVLHIVEVHINYGNFPSAVADMLVSTMRLVSLTQLSQPQGHKNLLLEPSRLWKF